MATVDKADYDDDIPVSSIDFVFDDREERADDAQVLSFLYMIFETPIRCCIFFTSLSLSCSQKFSVCLLKVPSHQIRLGLKWYGWIALGEYKDCRWLKDF